MTSQIVAWIKLAAMPEAFLSHRLAEGALSTANDMLQRIRECQCSQPTPRTLE